MPVIVIGADAAHGPAIVDALVERAIEVRAFVTDPGAVADLRRTGAKVATGDVSDASHVEAATLRCFCAVALAEAAIDDRERSFASGPAEVAEAWLAAVSHAGVQRILWVDHPDVPLDPDRLATAAPETRIVGDGPDLAATIAELENAERL